MHDTWIQQHNDQTFFINSNHVHMSHKYIDDKPYLNGYKQTTATNPPTKSYNNNHLVKQQQDNSSSNSKLNTSSNSTISHSNSILNNNIKQVEEKNKVKQQQEESNGKVETNSKCNTKELNEDKQGNENKIDIDEDFSEEIEDDEYLDDDEEEEDEEEEEEEEFSEEDEEEEIYEEEGEEELEEKEELKQEEIKSIEKTKSSELDNSRLGKEEELLYLEYEWTFYYDQGVPKNTDNFSSHIESLGNFNTVQGFWSYWDNFRDLISLPDGANLRLFKKGIKPVWEDKENENGGRWVYQTKGISPKAILDIVLYIIGEQFEYSLDICGFVYSIRPGNRHFISIWNKSGSDQEIIDKTLLQFSEKLNLTFNYSLHNKPILNSPTSSSAPLTPSTSYQNFPTQFTPNIHHSNGNINGVTDSPKSNYHHKKSQSTSSLPLVGNFSCTKQQQQQQQVLNSPFSSYSNRNTKFSLVNNNSSNELLPTVSKTPNSNSNGNVSNRRTIDKHSSSPSIPIPFTINDLSKKESDNSVNTIDISLIATELSANTTPNCNENVELSPKNNNNICNNIEDSKILDKEPSLIIEEAISPLSSMAPNKKENNSTIVINQEPISQIQTLESNKVDELVEHVKADSTSLAASATKKTITSSENIIYEREDGGKHYKKGKDYDEDEEEEMKIRDEENKKVVNDEEEIEDILNEEEIEDTSDILTDSSLKSSNDRSITNSNKKGQQTPSKSNSKNNKKKSKAKNSNNTSNNSKQNQSSLHQVNKSKNNNSVLNSNNSNGNMNRKPQLQKSNIKKDITEFLNEHIKIIIMLLLIVSTTLIFQNL